MKSETIKYIDNLLNSEVNMANVYCVKYENKLIDKYKTQELAGFITEEESNDYNNLCNARLFAIEAYNDFKSHQW